MSDLTTKEHVRFDYFNFFNFLQKFKKFALTKLLLASVGIAQFQLVVLQRKSRLISVI